MLEKLPKSQPKSLEGSSQDSEESEESSGSEGSENAKSKSNATLQQQQLSDGDNASQSASQNASQNASQDPLQLNESSELGAQEGAGSHHAQSAEPGAQKEDDPYRLTNVVVKKPELNLRLAEIQEEEDQSGNQTSHETSPKLTMTPQQKQILKSQVMQKSQFKYTITQAPDTQRDSSNSDEIKENLQEMGLSREEAGSGGAGREAGDDRAQGQSEAGRARGPSVSVVKQSSAPKQKTFQQREIKHMIQKMQVELTRLELIPESIVKRFSSAFSSGMKLDERYVLLECYLRNEIQFFDFSLLGDLKKEELVEKNISEEEIQYQFCLLNQKSKISVLRFVLQQLQLFSQQSPYLYERFLTKEGNIQCLQYHTVKLLHLLQYSDLSILLESQISCQAAFQIVSFCVFILKQKIQFMDLFAAGVTDRATLVARWAQIIFESVHLIYEEDYKETIIVFVNFCEPGLTVGETSANEQWRQEKMLEFIQEVLTETYMSQSLVGKEILEIVNIYWNQKMRIQGLNAHQLIMSLSRQLKRQIKFVVHREPKSASAFTREMYQMYNNVFTHFNKYLMDNLSEDAYETLDDEQEEADQADQAPSQPPGQSPGQSRAEEGSLHARRKDTAELHYFEILRQQKQRREKLYKQLLRINLPQRTIDAVFQIYQEELRIQKIYQSQQLTYNARRSFEEALAQFFMNYCIFKSTILNKEEELQKETNVSRLIEKMANENGKFLQEIAHYQEEVDAIQ